MNALMLNKSATEHGVTLHDLIESGLDNLPLPGNGLTLQRWRALSSVAQNDLSIAKLFEAHTDALAILRELNGPSRPYGSSWGIWAAESGSERVQLQKNDRRNTAAVELRGSKSWCSGARLLSHALLTAWEGERGPYLVAVALRQPTIRTIDTDWHAVGMADTATNTVIFDGAIGTLVGAEHAYLSRPGFWHGAAGIAVCWFGGATMLANTLRAHLQNNARARNTHALAHLGAIDIALRQASALLSETAAWIDRYPNANAMPAALRVRGAVEATAQSVLEHAGRTLGASAFCKDAAFARMAADLPVFLRQSHAECDLAELGAALLADDITQEPFAWAL